MSQFGRKNQGIFIRKRSESQCSYATALFLNEHEVFLKSDLISPCHFQTVQMHWEMLERVKAFQVSTLQLREGLLHFQAPPPLFGTKGISGHSSQMTGTSSRPSSQQASNSPQQKKCQSRSRLLPP